MAKELGDINVNVKSKGVEKTSKEIQKVNKDQAKQTQQVKKGGLSGLLGGGAGMGAMMGGAGGLAGGGGKAGAGMGALMGGGAGGMGLGAIAGPLGMIVGLLMGFEPIQKILGAFMKVVQAFFAPLAIMLLKLLQPIMVMMIKLLPFWMQFWKDPIGGIKKALGVVGEALWDALKWLGNAIWSYFKFFYYDLPIMIAKKMWSALEWAYNQIATKVWSILYFIKDLPSNIWSMAKNFFSWITDLPGKIWEKVKQLGGLIVGAMASAWGWVTDLGGTIWTEIKKLPGAIADAIKGGGVPFVPGVQTGGMVQRGGLANIHRGEAVVSKSDVDMLVDELRRNIGGTSVVSISGGLEPFIENIEKNPNVVR